MSIIPTVDNKGNLRAIIIVPKGKKKNSMPFILWFLVKYVKLRLWLWFCGLTPMWPRKKYVAMMHLLPGMK